MDEDYSTRIFTGDNSGSLIMRLRKKGIPNPHQFCNDPDRLTGPSNNENV